MTLDKEKSQQVTSYNYLFSKCFPRQLKTMETVEYWCTSYFIVHLATFLETFALFSSFQCAVFTNNSSGLLLLTTNSFVSHWKFWATRPNNN